MKLPFKSKLPPPDFRKPLPAKMPEMPSLDLAAQYRWARVGGDFFDFVELPGDRLLILVLDIAGQRDGALDIAASVQEIFRNRGMELFGSPDVNVADATANLLLELNQSILTASKGIRCAPAFLGCYDASMGFLSYISAGFVPALLKDSTGVSVLGAGGLPLGLFSHAPHDANMSVLGSGSVLIVASRGLLETAAGSEEFGLGRLQSCVEGLDGGSADEHCAKVLQTVKDFAESGRRSWFRSSKKNASQAEDEAPGKNDVTVVALVRNGVKGEGVSMS